MEVSTKERWTLVYGKWGKYYEISNLGKVRRVGSAITVKACPSGKNGRLQIKLSDKGEYGHGTFMLSHLVLSAFRKEEVAGRRVEYRDKDSKNCTLDNLYFMGRAQTPTSKYGNNGGGRKEPNTVISGLASLIEAIWKELLPDTQKLLRRKQPA